MNKYKILKLTAVLLLLGLFLISHYTIRKDKLHIFVSGGIKFPIDEISIKFEKRYKTKIETDCGSGGMLLSKIILSNQGDIYIAPEQVFMQKAVKEKAVYPETVKFLAFMTPVITVQKSNPKKIRNLKDLTKPGIKIALCRPETTFLGNYALEIFQKAGIDEEIKKNIITYTPDPNHLLNLLILKKVDAGILWHFYQNLVPEEIENIPISFENRAYYGKIKIAVCSFTQNRKLSEKFINFCISDEAKKIFKKYGYILN